MSKAGKTVIITVLLLAISSIFTLVKPGEISVVYVAKWILGDYAREVQVTNDSQKDVDDKKEMKAKELSSYLADEDLEELELFLYEYDWIETLISGNHFLINLEDFYEHSRWGGPSPYKEIGYLKSSRLISVNLDDYSVDADINLPKGKVVYMDEEKYALLQGKTLKVYSMTEGQLISKERIQKLNRWKDWEVEVSGNRLFFSCGGEVVDWVEME